MTDVYDFEGCCTAKIIVDLGGSNTSEFGYHPATYAKLRKDVVRDIKNHKDGLGIISAIITSEQVTAQKVLKDLGFTGTGMAKKTRHAEVDIELYYLHCKDWEEPEQPADIVAPPAPVAAPQPFAAARNPAPQAALVERPRDAQGRFVAQEQRGYALSWRNQRPVTHFHRDQSFSTSDWRGEPITLTERELDDINQRRAAVGYRQLTFQPI